MPVLGPKYANYSNDGSGRDTFISHGNGGLYPPTSVAEYQKTFTATLRKNEKIIHYA